MRCIRCNSLIPDGSTFCPVCGAQVSNNPLGDDATRIASPSQPPHRQAAPPPHANYGAPMQQQQYYAPAPKPKNNTVLWVIVGILAAALLGLGGWLLMDTLSDKGDANQPSKDAQVVKASSSVDKQESQTSSQQAAQPEQQTSQPEQQISQPEPQQVAPVPQQSNPQRVSSDGTVVLKGKLNGDNVTFTLFPQGANYYVGSFQNHKMGVTWGVEGYLYPGSMEFRSTGLKKNWSFTAAGDQEVLSGTSSNGTVTYDMRLYYQ